MVAIQCSSSLLGTVSHDAPVLFGTDLFFWGAVLSRRVCFVSAVLPAQVVFFACMTFVRAALLLSHLTVPQCAGSYFKCAFYLPAVADWLADLMAVWLDRLDAFAFCCMHLSFYWAAELVYALFCCLGLDLPLGTLVYNWCDCAVQYGQVTCMHAVL
jgi:hypothetical protein